MRGPSILNIFFMALYACCIGLSFSIGSLLSLLNLPMQSMQTSFTVVMGVISIAFGSFITELYYYRPKPDCFETELRDDHREIYSSIMSVRNVIIALKKGIAELKSRDSNLSIPDLGMDFDKEIVKADERLQATRIAESNLPEIAAEYRRLISQWQMLTFLSLGIATALSATGLFVSDTYASYWILGASISLTAVTVVVLLMYNLAAQEPARILRLCRHHAYNIRFRTIYFTQLEKKLGLS